MTTTVEQTQRDLARLILLAVHGEEILITDAGQPVAKLVGVNPQVGAPDRAQWLTSLRELRESTSTVQTRKSSDDLLAEDRAGRD